MTATDLVAALRPVIEALDALGVSYFLTGSIASSAHGIARASLDADIVVSLAAEHIDPLVTKLEPQYYISREHLRTAVARRSSCNAIHLQTMFKIDFFVSRERPFDREAAARARRDAVDVTPDAPQAPIASAEDTVLAKLEWFQRGGEASERQWWDIVGVLRATPDIDRAYLTRWASSLGVENLLARALTDAES